MMRRQFTKKEQNEILKKVLRKTNQYYEQTVQQKEQAEAEDIFKDL